MTVSFQSWKQLYIHKCLFVCSSVRQLVTETPKQLEIIILPHSSFNLHHPSFILQLLSFWDIWHSISVTVSVKGGGTSTPVPSKVYPSDLHRLSFDRVSNNFFTLHFVIKLSWRNADKRDALSTNSLVVLILKIIFDSISRILIFGIWMFVHNNGKFSSFYTVTAYYSAVLLLLLFNLSFNHERELTSMRFWIGKKYVLRSVYLTKYFLKEYY